VPGAAGKGEQVADVRGWKYFCPFTWHISNIFVHEKQYTTATLIEQQIMPITKRPA
jgi:hypothetical protein